MPLELGKVREFAKAVSITGSDSAPSATGTPVPATFLQTALLWDEPGTNPFYDSGLNFEKLLHGEQRFDFTAGPPLTGETLEVTRRIDSVRNKQGRRGGTMTFVVETTEFRRENGELAATSTNTRVVTGQAASGEKTGPATGQSAPQNESARSDSKSDTEITAGATAARTSTTAPAEQKNVRDLGPTRLVMAPLTIHDSVVYQGASGDLNPIHHDPDFAAKAGFPTPFAVGMRQMGMLAEQVTSWSGAESLRSIAVRFHNLAWPGEALTYTCEINEVSQDGGTLNVRLGLNCHKPDSSLHLSGTACCTIPIDTPTARNLLGA